MCQAKRSDPNPPPTCLSEFFVDYGQEKNVETSILYQVFTAIDT